jgi:acetyltransferase-like isoleucine patch superfamily enzyme
MTIFNKINRFCKLFLSFIYYSWRFYSWGWKSILTQPDMLLNPGQISIGTNVEIRKGARLETFKSSHDTQNTTKKIEIGDGTSIHFYFHCGAFRSVKIGKNVLIAGRVFITDHDHRFNNPDIPTLQAGLGNIEPVIIEDEVWIGEGAVILKGVTIGKRSVVGANAVVTKNVPPYTVVGGVPAKFIKHINIHHG